MIFTELICDICANVFTEGVKPAQLRAGAKREGWTYVWDGTRMTDLCPTCSYERAMRARAERTLNRKL